MKYITKLLLRLIYVMISYPIRLIVFVFHIIWYFKVPKGLDSPFNIWLGGSRKMIGGYHEGYSNPLHYILKRTPNLSSELWNMDNSLD